MKSPPSTGRRRRCCPRTVRAPLRPRSPSAHTVAASSHIGGPRPPRVRPIDFRVGMSGSLRALRQSDRRSASRRGAQAGVSRKSSVPPRNAWSCGYPWMQFGVMPIPEPTNRGSRLSDILPNRPSARQQLRLPWMDRHPGRLTMNDSDRISGRPFGLWRSAPRLSGMAKRGFAALLAGVLQPTSLRRFASRVVHGSRLLERLRASRSSQVSESGFLREGTTL